MINNKYRELLESIISSGYDYTDQSRNVKCRQISDYKLSLKTTEVPILTTKKVSFHNVICELIWMLKGGKNIKWLDDRGVYIWHNDAYAFYKRKCISGKEKPLNEWLKAVRNPEDKSCDLMTINAGDLGPIYGQQWMNWRGQFRDMMISLTKNPMSRRHIINSWNVIQLEQMALPPCHWAFEIIPEPVKKGYAFTLKWHQRSTDVFLGLPYNILSYYCLGRIIEAMTGYKFKLLVGDLSNIHIYENAVEGVQEILKRDPWKYPHPTLNITEAAQNDLKTMGIDYFKDMSEKDFYLGDFKTYPNIKVPVLVPN